MMSCIANEKWDLRPLPSNNAVNEEVVAFFLKPPSSCEIKRRRLRWKLLNHAHSLSYWPVDVWCLLSHCRCRLLRVSFYFILNFKQLTALSIYFLLVFSSNFIRSLSSRALPLKWTVPLRSFFIVCRKNENEIRKVKQQTATVCDFMSLHCERKRRAHRHTRKRRMNLAPTINCYLAIISWIFPLSHHFFCAGRLQFS